MGRSLDDNQIATILGRDPPPKVEPGNRAEAAMAAAKELDDRIDAHVATNRQPGETHDAAYSRIMAELPALYAGHKAEKARILRQHGMGADAAVGGL